MNVVLTEVRDASDLAAIRALFAEYAEWIGIDLGFQDFEREVAELPGEYQRPGGALLLARVNEEVAGCVALRPLSGDLCEMKRLFVREQFRGAGAGRILAEAVLAKARELGYRTIRLDTLPTMTAAIPLYRSLGFREIAPYRYNPVEGALFFERDLREE